MISIRNRHFFLFALSALILNSTAFPKSHRGKPARRSPGTELSESTVSAPKDNEVCFSPDQGCDIKLWKFIQSATQSLDIAIFDLTHPKIVHEILVASARIPVRVIADRRQAKGEHSLVSTLIKAKVNVRFGTQRGIMHNKFTILDGKRLETGSFNYTDSASFRNQENQIYLSDPFILGRYQDQFARMWDTAKPATLDVARSKG